MPFVEVTAKVSFLEQIAFERPQSKVRTQPLCIDLN